MRGREGEPPKHALTKNQILPLVATSELLYRKFCRQLEFMKLDVKFSSPRSGMFVLQISVLCLQLCGRMLAAAAPVSHLPSLRLLNVETSNLALLTNLSLHNQPMYAQKLTHLNAMVFSHSTAYDTYPMTRFPTTSLIQRPPSSSAIILSPSAATPVTVVPKKPWETSWPTRTKCTEESKRRESTHGERSS